MAKLALLSVSDKTGLVDLARQLVQDFHFDLLSSGGTAQTLQAAGLPVIKVSDYTGSPEILAGRVKTLHPRIHGGILARPDLERDRTDLANHSIRPIELVVVNLYPFEHTIAQPGVTLEMAIENIDIGGPTLLRAAAKNHAYVTVLCHPDQYDIYLQTLRDQQGVIPLGFRQACALRAFQHTTTYDRAIATYLNQVTADPVDSEPFPSTWHLEGHRVQTLRYGENPHQQAAWYQTDSSKTGWVAATQLQGKALSYNNLVDLEAARRIIAEFPDTPAVAILKHNNPCGVALGTTLLEAYEKALAADAVSAFGGIVALNQAIDPATATALTQTFLECVVAPACSPEAAAILRTKANLRVLVLSNLLSSSASSASQSGSQSGSQSVSQSVTTTEPSPSLLSLAMVVKPIAGGFLLQTADAAMELPEQWQGVTTQAPTPEQREELLFAWKVVKHVKSNAIVVSHDRATLGIGAGQMNRVGAVKIALDQAGTKAQGAVLASDAFFPFDDSVRTAAAAGISAIIQPGGSMRDRESIEAANALGLVMVFTGVRHFLH